MTQYPQRGDLFALHFLKWLFASGSAHEVGPDATALILAVVSLEDEFFCQRPVNFFNEQLMDRCGIKSEHSLIRARQVAVDAGLLHYTAGRKRQPGRYFVLGFTAESAVKVRLSCSESEVKSRPSSPNPNPIPKKSTRKRDSFDPLTEEIPVGLDSEAFRIAWREWVQHRSEIKKPLKPTSCRQQLHQLATWDQRRAIAALRYTIAQGWQGLREPEGSPDTNGHAPPPPKPPAQRGRSLLDA